MPDRYFIFTTLFYSAMVMLPLAFQRYWIARWASEDFERDALAIYLFSIFSLFVSVVLNVILVYAVVLASLFLMFSEVMEHAIVLIPLLMIFVSVWFLIIVGWCDATALERRAVTKYQIWIQDLLVAGMMTGVVFSFFQPVFRTGRRENQELCIIGELLTVLPSFFIALSVLRFHPHAKRPGMRAIWIAVFMLIGGIPYISIVWMLPSWFSFRLAMSRVPMDSTSKAIPPENE